MWHLKEDQDPSVSSSSSSSLLHIRSLSTFLIRGVRNQHPAVIRAFPRETSPRFGPIRMVISAPSCGSCRRLRQRRPTQPKERNNRKQTLFDEGPPMHTHTHTAEVKPAPGSSRFSAALQDKQVAAPYGGVRKINNLGGIRAQMSGSGKCRHRCTGYPTFPIKGPEQKGPQRDGRRYGALTGLRTTLEFQKAETGNCLWT